MTNSLPSFLTHNLAPFKELWAHSTEEEKVEACTIEDPRILSDLADTSNNALLVCELHKLYTKNRFINWRKEAYGDKRVINIHTYQFFINENEILEEKIANLFSSIYMIISAFPKQTNPSEDPPHDIQPPPKSLITVQKGKIESILTLIDEAKLTFFPETETEPKLNAEDFFEIYSFFATYYFQNDFFNTIDSQTLRKFLCKLLAVSFVIKSSLFNSFQKKIMNGEILNNQSPSFSLQRDISNKLSHLALHHKSSQNYLAPTNMKTVSELENIASSSSSQNPHPTNKQASLRKTSGLSSGEENHISNIHHHHQTESSKRNSLTLDTEKASHSESGFDKGSKSSLLFNHSQDTRDQTPLPLLPKEDSCPNILSIYDGVSMGDLTVTFHKTDVYLCDNDNEGKAPQIIKVNKEQPVPVQPTYIIGDPHYIHHDNVVFQQQPQFYFFPPVATFPGFALNPMGGFIAAPIQIEQPRINTFNPELNGSKGGASIPFPQNFIVRENRERSPEPQLHQGNEVGGANHIGNEGLQKEYDKNLIFNSKEKQKISKIPPRFKRQREIENNGM